MPFADALTPLWARLRARYHQTPLPEFFRWWWSELRACLPSSWQAILQAQEALVLLELRSDGLRIERVVGEQRTLLTERTFDAEPLTLAELQTLLGDSGQRLPRIALVPAAAVLMRKLSFPAAAVANVRTLVGFEIDRQTPFRADQVEYDCKLRATEAGARSVTVDLAVIPREALAALMKPLAALEGHLDAIDISAPGGRGGFNLLSTHKRRSHDQRPLLINLGLFSASLVVLLIAMNQLVENRLDAVRAIQADVDAQRAQARSTAQLRKVLDDAAAGANFLAELKAKTPSVVGLVRVLTDTLPDDTFIERVSFTGDTVSITVQSASAAKLIELIQTTPQLKNPSLAGPIQPDPRTGKDRATLTAQFYRADKEAS